MTGPKPVALPLGYSPMNKKRGDRRDLNPRMPEPQSGALTTSPRPPSSYCYTKYTGRGSRIRTHSDGFGDRSFALQLYPSVCCGGGGQIRTAEPNGSGFTVRRV